jgi:hypothetical protein
MPRNSFKVWSRWAWEHWRNNWLLDKWEDGNICTDQGLTDLLNVHFSGGTQKTAWHIALFEDNYTPLVTNTYAVPGYVECSALEETARPQWSDAGAAAKAITNSANKASFTFTGAKTIYGGALVAGGTGAATIGDTGGGGVLFCVSQFSGGVQAVVSGDVLKVSVSLSVADS